MHGKDKVGTPTDIEKPADGGGKDGYCGFIDTSDTLCSYEQEGYKKNCYYEDGHMVGFEVLVF